MPIEAMCNEAEQGEGWLNDADELSKGEKCRNCRILRAFQSFY
jgi:hypothetical protein